MIEDKWEVGMIVTRNPFTFPINFANHGDHIRQMYTGEDVITAVSRDKEYVTCERMGGLSASKLMRKGIDYDTV